MNTPFQFPAPAGANMQPSPTAGDRTADVFDRYADSVVGCYANQYDAVEVHGVRNFAADSENGTCYEIDNETPNGFSVYVHLESGGLDCVGDFSKYDDAAQYGAEVSSRYGWPLRNYVLDQHRIATSPSLQ